MVQCSGRVRSLGGAKKNMVRGRRGQKGVARMRGTKKSAEPGGQQWS